MSSSTEKNNQVSEMQHNLELLQELPFFSSFPVQALKLLALLATRGNFSPGDHLYEEGDDPDRAYLILHGSLILTTSNQDGEQTTVEKFVEGDFLGSLSLLGCMPALFNLTAARKTSVLTLGRVQFSKTLEQFPEIQPLSLKAVLKDIHQWERTNLSETAPCCYTRMGVTAL